jgi:hypothetical protein
LLRADRRAIGKSSAQVVGVPASVEESYAAA